MDKRSLALLVVVLVVGAALGALVARGLGRAAPEAAAPQTAAARPPTAEAVRIGNPDPPAVPAVPELTSLNQLFRGVAARVTPTVVFIEVESGAARLPQGHPDVFRGRPRLSAGSGVLISADGYVVTNAHVVDGAERIAVLLNDKREFEGTLVGLDQTTDLAVIHLEGAEDLPVITFGGSEALAVGEWVLAIGNPFRLTSTVTAGIVSALGRQVDIIDDSFRIEDFIQTDAAINPGNSGGALVNLRGELVGVATAIATESGAYEGYGFAVPTDLVTRVAEDLIAYGEVRRGYLGVEIRPVTDREARRLGLERVGGVLVTSVAADGAAAAAGLRENDVLVAIDGEAVDAPNQFQSRIALRRPGDAVQLAVYRNGQRLEIPATLIGRDDEAFRSWVADIRGREAPIPAPTPEDDAMAYELDAWGLGLRELTAAERRGFGVQGGAYVAYVAPGGPAEADGLPPDAVVTAIEGQPVRSAEDARAALRAAELQGVPALLTVRRRNGTTVFYDVLGYGG